MSKEKEGKVNNKKNPLKSLKEKRAFKEVKRMKKTNYKKIHSDG